MNWRRLAAALAMPLLLAAGCGGEGADAEEGAPERVVSVTVVEAQAQLVEIVESALGTVRTIAAPDVSAEVSARVERLHADTGDSVAAGDLLAELDDQDFVIERDRAAAEIERIEARIENQERVVWRQERLSEQGHAAEVSVEEAVTELRALRAELATHRASYAVAEEELPLGYSVNLIGQAQELGRTVDALVFVLLLAAALVYIVLASQFNSFVQPLMIMAAQPVALVGGTLALWAGGFTLNVYSMIGLLLLMGLVTKNGILLVDLTNQYREKQGMAVNEALAAACPIRLRPVLMTSLTLILAMVPALLGLGAGAETNAPLAAAIIGGMLVSMMLTLVVIPAAYSIIESFNERRLGMTRGRSPARASTS